jgi:lysine-specific demethylase 8/hypoxia-inducible factor 1-alpha inhibitor (HIF hydroxylase)
MENNGNMYASSPDYKTVDRVDISSFTSDTFYRDFRRQGMPVIITGAFRDTPEWNISYLREKLGGQSFTARHYGPNRFQLPKTEWRSYCELKTLDFNEYADLLENGTARHESIYLAQVNILDTPAAESIQGPFHELKNRTGLNEATGINLWLGPGGHTEPLHFDTADGTLIQLYGSKHLTLFPPSQSRNLYPFRFFGGGLPPWFSQVYVNNPDLEAFPQLARALPEQISVKLNPGEALFIPANWWHEVTALGSSYVCSLNRFWKVRPLQRVFASPRSATIYGVSNIMAKGLAKPMLDLHGRILKMRTRKAVQQA